MVVVFHEQLKLSLEVLSRVDRRRQENLGELQDFIYLEDAHVLEDEDELDFLDRAVVVDVTQPDELVNMDTLVLEHLGKLETNPVVGLEANLF